jgi:hypothetical protein
MTVVKVQKPVASDAPDTCVVYGYVLVDPRLRIRIQHIWQTHVWAVLKLKPKAFFHATWNTGRNEWDLGERARTQSW